MHGGGEGLTMKRPLHNNNNINNAKGINKFWYFVTTSFLIWFLLLCLYFSGLQPDRNRLFLSRNNAENFVISNEIVPGNSSSDRLIEERGQVTESNYSLIDNFFIGGNWSKYLDAAYALEKSESKNKKIQHSDSAADKGSGSVQEDVQSASDPDSDSCSGQYIYIHDLPCEFNADLLKHCTSLDEWTNMCTFITNSGLGPRLRNSEKAVSNSGWFETNQFMLEVIFHNRMKQYKCLTNDSSSASAIFVPYYAGLDVARYLWNSTAEMRDFYSLSLVKWLRDRPEWKRMWGRDHFLVAGRITWDFRRLKDGNSDWGNKLMNLPESRNMTMLTIESSPWTQNDIAIPYPTHFHPSRDNEVFQWQNRMRRSRRRYLFSFAGARRPNMTDSIRHEIIDQCVASRRKCKLLECIAGSNKCYRPIPVMKLFQSSTFCLQPSGDSYTRRSTFDSILAGCIPVFFHPGSAYVQYIWHLPKDYTKYSVFIPGKGVKDRKASIERILSRIPKARVQAMREQVLKLIPGVVYADPRSSLENLEDAFDITIEGVLERIDKTKKDMNEGKEISDEGEVFTWKKSLFGTVEKHEWDRFFERT